MRPKSKAQRTKDIKFQSTHPSGVRPYHAGDECVDCRISIHAPQWGATSNQLVGISFVFLISIHAPQWGATGRFGNHVEHRTDFNPRTPVGCDWVMVPPVVMLPRFQSTHPSGVRQSFHIPLWAAASFQSTHPSGVRRPTACNACTTAKYFNPRTPVGCDTGGPQARRPDADFNPRTPVGCDRSGLRGRGGFVEISIHAPQWGATIFAHILPTLFRISIHAPQWGATCGRFSTRFTVVFQSTHPSGVRHSLCHPVLPLLGISIHAPQWGATWPERTWASTPTNFNPRTPVGCDAQTGKDAGDHFKFQSTHPSGVRPGPVPATAVAGYFNPRTPVGCDLEMAAKRGDTEAISIHAPQWGATHALGHDNGAVGISIHAPQWGATARLGQAGVHRPISIHAPQWGATTITSIGKSGAGDFNPRTPVGCDLHQLDVQLNIIKFQSTHPSGVRRVYYLQSHVTRHISIHAPQWGATTPYLLDKFIQQFQSTHPSGVRRSIVTPSSTWT